MESTPLTQSVPTPTFAASRTLNFDGEVPTITMSLHDFVVIQLAVLDGVIALEGFANLGVTTAWTDNVTRTLRAIWETPPAP